MSGRLLLSGVFFGFAAYWLAIGLGIPAWRQWEPGDAADIGMMVANGVWFLGWHRVRALAGAVQP